VLLEHTNQRRCVRCFYAQAFTDGRREGEGDPRQSRNVLKGRPQLQSFPPLGPERVLIQCLLQDRWRVPAVREQVPVTALHHPELRTILQAMYRAAGATGEFDVAYLLSILSNEPLIELVVRLSLAPLEENIDQLIDDSLLTIKRREINAHLTRLKGEMAQCSIRGSSIRI
jgi:hypothetical protein